MYSSIARLLSLALPAPVMLFAQTTFQRQIASEQSQYTFTPSAIGASSGDVVLTTSSIPFGGSLFPYPSITRLDSAGQVLWMRADSILGMQSWTETLERPSGDYLLLSDKYMFSQVGGYIMRDIDTTGTEQWRRSYSSLYLQPQDAAMASDSGYLFCGAFNGWAHVMKTDTSGLVEWSRTYYSEGDGFTPTCISGTPEGGVLVGGSFAANGGPFVDMMVMRLDSSGGIVWARVYPHPSTIRADHVNAVAPTADGGILVACHAPVYNNDYILGELLKLNADGTIAWQKVYTSGPDDAEFYDVRELADGRIAACGYVTDPDHNQDLCLLIADSLGAPLWARSYGLDLVEAGYRVCTAHDGGYILSGQDYTSPLLNNAAYLVRTDSLGATGCADTLTTHTATDFDLTTELLTVLDSSATLAITTGVEVLEHLSPVVEEPCGINTALPAAPTADILSTWPNPFQDVLHVGPLPVDARSMELRALDGRLVRGGAARTQLAGEGLAPGIYLLLIIGDQRTIEQVVVKE